MKKILSLIVFLAICSVGICQATFSHTASNPTGTITNAGADTMSFATSYVYSDVAIQPAITKASGTMAGNSVLYGSLDGTHYVAIDSTANTDVPVNSSIWTFSHPVYTSYRIITKGSTTVSATTAATYRGILVK